MGGRPDRAVRDPGRPQRRPRKPFPLAAAESTSGSGHRRHRPRASVGDDQVPVPPAGGPADGRPDSWRRESMVGAAHRASRRIESGGTSSKRLQRPKVSRADQGRKQRHLLGRERIAPRRSEVRGEHQHGRAEGVVSLGRCHRAGPVRRRHPVLHFQSGTAAGTERAQPAAAHRLHGDRVGRRLRRRVVVGLVDRAPGRPA